MGSLRAQKSGSLRAPENETFTWEPGTWGGFNGHGGWDWDMGGFRGQAWWVRTRESDLQGLTWGHGIGTRVRFLEGLLVDFGPEGGSPGMYTCAHLSMSLRACFSASACSRHV